MVNSVNSTSNTNVLYNGVTLKSPQELYGGSTKVSNPYTKDAVRVAGKDNSNSELFQFGVGALSGYKYQGAFSEASNTLGDAIMHGGVKEVIGGIGQSSQILGVAAYNAAGVGAIVGGGVSALVNSAKVLNGKQSFGTGASNVVVDSLQGAVSGIGGVAVGGISAMAINALGFAGTPVVIASVIGGAIGATAANRLFKTEKVRSALQGY